MSYRLLLLTAAATSLALAACNQQPAAPATGAPIASLPLADAAPPPETPAPYANALPPAPPITRVSTPPQSVYSYVDDAYALSDALADSPPDYTVDYDGVRPWVWRSGDGEYRVVEDTPDGERYYYYRGDSDYPYLIQDPQYCYAYNSGGELVEVYDSYGRPYPNYGAAALEIAAQYLARGRSLHYAAIHDQRQAAYAADWRARRATVLAPQQQWASEQQRNPAWRQYHDQRLQQAPPQLAALQQERTQRQAYATRVAPVIAAAPPAPRPEAPRNAGPVPGAPALAAQGREQQRQQQVQADTVARVQAQAQAQAGVQQRAQAEAAQRQQQQAQAHDQQQRAQADAANRSQAEAAQRQQQAQAKSQQQAQAEAAQHQQQAQAHDQQQGAQAEAANRAQQQAQARDQQKAQQAEASRQAQAAAQHQQQAQVQAQAAAQHQQQAQAAAAAQHQQEAAAHAAMAQQHQQQAVAQHAQAAAAQQAARAAAAKAAQPPKPKPDDEKK